MAPIGQDMLPCCSLPDLHRAIVACRGATPAIGRRGHGLHSIPVAAIGDDAGTLGGVPHEHGLIIACGSDLCSPRRPGHGCDPAGMTGTDMARGFLWFWQRCLLRYPGPFSRPG